jgi:hypothetical protein
LTTLQAKQQQHVTHDTLPQFIPASTVAVSGAPPDFSTALSDTLRLVVLGIQIG